MSVRPEDFEVNFHEYAERKDAYILIEKCALIVAESDIDLDVFIENFVRERGLSEDWSNFWSGVKDTAAWAWDKTKNFGPVKAGADRLNRAFDDKYMKAYNSLKTLHDFLSKVEARKSLTGWVRCWVNLARRNKAFRACCTVFRTPRPNRMSPQIRPTKQEPDNRMLVLAWRPPIKFTLLKTRKVGHTGLITEGTRDHKRRLFFLIS